MTVLFYHSAVSYRKNLSILSVKLCRSHSTFVSKHFQIESQDIHNLIQQSMQTEYRIRDNGDIEIKECKLCLKGNKSNLDNMWKLKIAPNGCYYCFRCSHGGSWFDLKKRLQNPSLEKSTPSSPNSMPRSSSSSSKTNTSATSSPPKKTYALPNQSQSIGYYRNLFPISTSESEKLQQYRIQALAYLNSKRQLNDDILKQYGVGCAVQQFMNEKGEWKDQLCITFPWMLPTNSFVNQKNSTVPATASKDAHSNEVLDSDVSSDSSVNDLLSQHKLQPTHDIGSEDALNTSPLLFTSNQGTKFLIVRNKFSSYARAIETKGLQRVLPKGGQWGLFGWNTVEPHHEEVILTEGEYDAMAVAQGLKAVQDNPNEYYPPTPAKNPKKYRKISEAVSPPEPTETLSQKILELPSISLPNGCNSLPPDVLSMLERFKIIYLWLDFDASGQDAVQKVARKLGVHRCVIVKPLSNMMNETMPKDANDALRQENGPKIIYELLKNASPLRHESVLSFSDVRDSVISQMVQVAAGKASSHGTLTDSLPTLSELSKGFRRGELVVFTGPTGSGKTTLLSQLSVDFAIRGAPTLWGSFEVKNEALVSKMLKQYYAASVVAKSPPPPADDELLQAGGGEGLGSNPFTVKEKKTWKKTTKSTKNAEKTVAIPTVDTSKPIIPIIPPLSSLNATEIQQVADDFEGLPIKFLNFYGSTEINKLIDAMEYSVYKDDIKHIIIDNLQFMMPRSTYGNHSYDRFNVQDSMIDVFRKFATEKNVNVILVIHPRKEDDGTPLSLSSIFGSAKATQEADLVMILQKAYGSISLDILKNRYDGSTGKVRLVFDKPNTRFFEERD